MINRIKSSILRHWKWYRDLQKVRKNTHLIHGPGHVVLNNDEAAVVSLMKNAAYFIREFITHHQSLGVRHIVIIDNGSSDDTVAIASGYANVTILQNTLPPKQFECLLRSESAKNILNGGWVIFVDSDELFEPAIGNLSKLLSYLEQNQYTAMCTQMLDLYDPSPYGESKNKSYSESVKRCNHYSIDRVVSVRYSNSQSNPYAWYLTNISAKDPNVKMKFGGVRNEVFGEWCLLSKLSLVRNLNSINMMVHPHFATNVELADVTGLLRHYKLSGDFIARDQQSVDNKTWDHEQDLLRLTVANNCNNLNSFTIRPENPQQYEGRAQLIDQGFLTVSKRYLQFIST